MSTPQRRGLGRGLELLVGGADERQELAQIRVDDITPNARQPRRRFEPEATAGLAESIRRQGLLQPVVVRPRPDGGYELIAGERRWRAAREAGIEEVPALVREADDRDSLLLALVENVAREQLSAVEEARAYAALLDEFGLSLGELARARRPLEVVGVEQAATARAAGRGALDARPQRAHRRPCAGRARGSGERRAGAAREAHRAQAVCPCARPSALLRPPEPSGSGAAQTLRSIPPSRRASRRPQRVRREWRRRSRAAGSRFAFADETELEELAEALERLVDDLDS